MRIRVCVVAVFCMVCRGVLGGGSCVGGSATWCGGMVLRGVSVCLFLFFSSAAVVVARDGRRTWQPRHHMLAAAGAATAAVAAAAAVVVMVWS